ncbi:MAG: hypothetical protein ABL911_08825 [Gallionella sp.]
MVKVFLLPAFSDFCGQHLAEDEFSIKGQKMEYYLWGKFAFFILIPVNILFRQRIAIEKWGLEKYKTSRGKDLFSAISWRDSSNPLFRTILRLTNYGIIFSLVFYLAGLLYVKIL